VIIPGYNYKGEVSMADKEMKLEESFEKLNSIMEALEKSDVSLEDSFRFYQEGMKLLKACNDSIDKVEKELIILGESGETNEL
jgi:exodeoxyribonuclease VII small subunit